MIRRRPPGSFPEGTAPRSWVPRRYLPRILAVLVVVVLVVPAVLIYRSRHVVVPLQQQALGISADGSRVPVTVPDPLLFFPGTRVLKGSPAGRGSAEENAERERLAAAQRAWLDRADLSRVAEDLRPIVRAALLDLDTLRVARGAVIAGPSPAWHYVWVRDSAFVAVALARVGYVDDAVEILRFLAGEQEPDGAFHARYRPDGSGPPDDRGLQEDGPGWFLWAGKQILDHTPQARREAVRGVLLPWLEACAARLINRIDPETGLPRPSSDYWEVGESRTTLAIAATSLAGLDAAVALDVRVHGKGLAQIASDVRAALETRFGRSGYHRYASGDGSDDADAAVALLLPPFQVRAVADAVDAVRDSVSRMRRPAGGLAPGEGWKNDGISWTPETALMAVGLQSAGDARSAASYLRWLQRHRTVLGAYPEKVLHDGRPAAVAPLAWTCALVVLLATEPAV